jgi:hypothetical protein
MSYTNGLDKPSDYFDTKLYTGTGSSLNVTGLNFKPDLTWVKRRDTTGGNKWTDAVRGAGIVLNSNATDGEFSQTGISSFNSDGFTVGTGSADFNASGGTYASWNFLGANTTVSNTAGSITSTVSANTTSVFSIVSYTGNATAGATVGHGLGAVPKMIIIKDRDVADNWNVYTAPTGNNSHMHLNLTNAASGSSSYWNTTTPTSSVFSLGSSSAVNNSGSDFIAYCFAEVKGFSKFGSYVGNGSADGTFIYTGFKPAFILLKNTNTGDSWRMVDNKRSPYNVVKNFLNANDSSAESTTVENLDFTSNGFKLRVGTNDFNGSSYTFIYMAFAESPFTTSTGIPSTAR